MAGDYTRETFDPFKLFSGLHKQQGRVSLDSEFNEFENILDRRDRAEMYDLWGEAIVPLTTPTGFEIGVNGSGQLTIGVGRAYVDGILAECFGDISDPLTTVRDDHLGGIDGSGPVVYELQPFFYQPNFPALSAPPGGINLVYLDVWQREVTVFEDDRLREPALNGPDTATRVQTAWQVKILPNADASSCTTPPPSWTTLTAPSTARMTALAAPAAPAPGPCVINPAGGYTGLENRLYRVEIHTAGTLTGGGGTTRAQFKWSRDNASLAARVLAIAPSGLQSVITVTSTGRDSWMRFEPGHHLELLDDHIESAMRETGTGGPMARVVTVNHATGEITIDRNLSTFTVVAARHPRIRRWDIATTAEPLARDTDNGVAMALEEGITVTFGGNNSDTLHAGDCWVFAARTADGSIDPVNNMPPRGILHHFARLALVTSGTPPVVLSDCRHHPEAGAGCCTVVVRPGERIQAAIDSLPPEGGCVCLKAGIHVIAEPIIIAGDHISLHGESLGAVVTRREGGLLLVVRKASRLRIASVEFRSPGGNDSATVMILGGDDVTFDDCLVTVAGKSQLAGVYAGNTSNLALRSLRFAGAAIGVWLDEGSRGITIASCAFQAPEREAGPTPRIAIFGQAVEGPFCAEDNEIAGVDSGIVLNQKPDGRPTSLAIAPRIRANRIQLVANGNQELRTFGIDTAARDSIVEANWIDHAGGNVTGIRLCGSGSIARDNAIAAHTEAWGSAVAIAAGDSIDGKPVAVERITIAGSRVEGLQHGIVLTWVSNAVIEGNMLGDGSPQFGAGIVLDASSHCIAVDNQIVTGLFGILTTSGARNRIEGNVIGGGTVGIGVGNEIAPTLCGNRLSGCEQLGIYLQGIGERCEVSANRLVRCGWNAALGVAIGAASVTGEWHVEANEVMDAGLPPAPGGAAAATAYGIAGVLILEARVTDNLVTYSNVTDRPVTGEDRALRLMGYLEYTAVFGQTSVTIGFAAQINDNKFIGASASSLVELLQNMVTERIFNRFERVMFSGNYCAHLCGNVNDKTATVSLCGRACNVANNQVKPTTPNYHSFNFNGMPGPFVGNVIGGDVLPRPVDLPTPRAAFNMMI